MSDLFSVPFLLFVIFVQSIVLSAYVFAHRSAKRKLCSTERTSNMLVDALSRRGYAVFIQQREDWSRVDVQEIVGARHAEIHALLCDDCAINYRHWLQHRTEPVEQAG